MSHHHEMELSSSNPRMLDPWRWEGKVIPKRR